MLSSLALSFDWKEYLIAFVKDGGIWDIDLYLCNEDLLVLVDGVCHISTFQLLEGCDKGFKPR